MSKIDDEQRQEFSVSTAKFKGSIEVKNLEYSINYNVRGFGFSQGKARGPLL
jgi:predicted esterase